MTDNATQQPDFSHLDKQGSARMVDVGHKPIQFRRAIAEGQLVCQKTTIQSLREKALPKGDVLTVAKIAGIQAAKRTADLIPLCHPLPLDHIDIQFDIGDDAIGILCNVKTSAKTGAEMEALTATAVTALTLYDMCKAIDKTMRIEGIRVVEKRKE